MKEVKGADGAAGTPALDKSFGKQKRYMESDDSYSKAFAKEFFIIRYGNESDDDFAQSGDPSQDLEILTENDNLDAFIKHNKNLKRLKFIQTAIRSRTGIGKPIVINFYAPQPQVKPGDKLPTIKYDFRACGDEITMIRNCDDTSYCFKQCQKICYFVQKMHS